MRIRYAGAAAVLSAAAIALATPGVAGAVPTAEVVPGRARIMVTVYGLPVGAENCKVDPDADAYTRSLPMDPSRTRIVHFVPSGPQRVLVWCPDGGTVYDGVVDVLPADPWADAADLGARIAGHLDRITDPTLR